MTNEPNLDHLDIVTALKLEADLQVILDRYVAYGSNSEVINATYDLIDITEKLDMKIYYYVQARLDAHVDHAIAAYDARYDARVAESDAAREARYLREARANVAREAMTIGCVSSPVVAVVEEPAIVEVFVENTCCGKWAVHDPFEVVSCSCARPAVVDTAAIEEFIDDYEALFGQRLAA